MSYTVMYLMPQCGPLMRVMECDNSWGFAPYVWRKMQEKYLPDHPNFLMGDAQPIWDLWKSPQCELSERLTMLSTFDWAVIEIDKVVEMATHYQRFVELHPPGASECHLLAMAHFFDSKMQRFTPEKLAGVCFYGTSVAENLWWVYDDKEDNADDGRYFDLSLDREKHPPLFIFEKFKSLTEQNCTVVQ